MGKNITVHSMLLSVLMPTYNVEKYIKEAIFSILTQDYSNFELIIIDDASSDNTVSLIKEFKDNRIKFYQNDINIGVSKNRNLLLTYANGQFISFFDSDDISCKNRFSKQIKYLINFPKIDLVFSKVKYIDEYGRDIYFRKNDNVLNHTEITSELLFNNVLSTSTVVFRSEIKSLMINNKVSLIAEDYYIWANLFINNKKFKCINEKLVKYRVRDSGSTKKYITNLKSSLDIIHKLLLENLGVKVSQEILDVHNSLYTFNRNSNNFYIINLLMQNENLFNEIILNNSKYNIYNNIILRKSIKKNWYLKCKSASKYIDNKSVKIYKNSNYTTPYYLFLINIFLFYYKLKQYIYGK